MMSLRSHKTISVYLLLELIVSLVSGQTLTSIVSPDGSDGDLTGRVLSFTEVGRGVLGSHSLQCLISGASNVEWQFPGGTTIPSGSGEAMGSQLFQDVTSVRAALRRGPNYFSPDGQYCCVRPTTNERRCVYFTACPTLRVLGFGEYTYNAADNTATVTCVEGFAPLVMELVCNDGTMTWSAEPACRATCEDLDVPANGMINYSPSTTPRFVNTMANHSCNTGYELSGGTMRTCNDAGNGMGGAWSGNTFTCQRVNCGVRPTVTNGAIETSTGTTLFEETVTYSCNTGYQLSGSATVTCQADGMWSTPPTCNIDCGTLLNPANGQVGTSGTSFMSTATYSCDASYTLNGPATRTCQDDGMWSGSEPTCQELCPRQDLTNGMVTYSSQTVPPPVGTVAIYSCNTGFELVGSAGETCVAGTGWSEALPDCNPVDCGNLTDPAVGTVDTSSGTTFMSTASYSCTNGLVVVGPQTRTCQANGMWSGSDPTCGCADAVTNTSSAGYPAAIAVILVLLLAAVIVIVVLVILLVVRTRQLKEARAHNGRQQVYDTPDQVYYEDVSKLDVGGANKKGHTHPSAMELRQCPAYAPTEVPSRTVERIYDN